MTKAVFVHNPTSSYNDNPTEAYPFLHKYKRTVERAIDDFIIYFEPKSGGRQSYVAMARLVGFSQDRSRAGMYTARIDPLSYVPFPTPVPYSGPSGYYESALTNHDGSLNRGLIQHAIRPLRDIDFELIVEAGLRAPLHSPALQDARTPFQTGLAEPAQAVFHRPTISVNRKLRDRAFRDQIQVAYDRTCAVSGLKILNSGGNPEVQAAHIKPVADNGPDWVRNGLALTSTLHWMFDNGLISIADDYRILRADQHIPEAIKPLLSRQEYLTAPTNKNWTPHPEFLRFHRESRFVGR